MTYLLDTCTLLWWWSEPEKLSKRALALIENAGISVRISSGSAWEIATKYRLGKLPQGGRIIAEWNERLAIDGFKEITITSLHAIRAGGFTSEHRDPFDRVIAAQAVIENYAVMTPDREIEYLGATRIW